MASEAASGESGFASSSSSTSGRILKAALFLGFVIGGVLVGTVEWDSTAEISSTSAKQAPSAKGGGLRSGASPEASAPPAQTPPASPRPSAAPADPPPQQPPQRPPSPEQPPAVEEPRPPADPPQFVRPPPAKGDTDDLPPDSPETPPQEQDGYTPKVHTAGRECDVQGENFGNIDSIEQCDVLTMSKQGSGCSELFMFSTEHRDWGCRCCAPGSTGRGSQESRWTVYVASATKDMVAKLSAPAPEQPVGADVGMGGGRYVHRGRECGAQGPNFGHLQTPEECDQLAANDPECGHSFMFSTNHPEWQCRCCTQTGADGGQRSEQWDVYRVLTPRPTVFPEQLPIPTLQPVPKPFAGLPMVSLTPAWVVREDALVIDARPGAEDGKAHGGILIVQAVLADAGAIWGKQAARPQWLRAILATNREHARRHGHAMILRAQPTQPQLTRWQVRQCNKKSTTQCVQENERENFNWEKHLMMSDYLLSSQAFTHVLMLDADAALVRHEKNTLRGIAAILDEKGADLFMTNEDWLLYGENRINGGLMMAKNTQFTQDLFRDTFDAHIMGPKKLKNWRIGVDLMECSSNEQICLNELWSGSGKEHFAHKAMMASGLRYNRGAEKGLQGLGIDHIGDAEVELMHWMGGSKSTAGFSLCRGKAGDLTGEGPSGYGCRE